MSNTCFLLKDSITEKNKYLTTFTQAITNEREQGHWTKKNCIFQQAFFHHILSGCKTSLNQGHYMWRHNQVLKIICMSLRINRFEVNSLPVNDRDSRISFVWEGQNSRLVQTVLANGAKHRIGDCWLTMYCCDCYETMELYSKCECIVYFIELTIPFEDESEEAFERKKLKYAELVAETRQAHTHTRPVEISVRGFVVKSITTLLLDFGFSGRSLKWALEELLRLLKKQASGCGWGDRRPLGVVN